MHCFAFNRFFVLIWFIPTFLFIMFRFLPSKLPISFVLHSVDPIGGERWKICSVPSAVVRVELHIAVRGMEEAGVILVSHPGSEAALGVNGGFVSQQL